MRNKKLIGILGICIVILACVMLYRGITSEEQNPYQSPVTTGQVCRAVALLVAEEEDCQVAASHFENNTEWYVPYMNLLYERGYITEKQIIPGKKEAQTAFTYKKLEQLWENMKISDKKLQGFVNNHNATQTISGTEWAEIVTALAEYLNVEKVEEKELSVVATVSNAASLAAWTLVTTEGQYVHTGISMDSYIDKKVSVLTKGDRILCVKALVSEEVTYPNALVTNAENGTINAFINGVVRTFSIDDKKLSVTNAIADISLEKGKVKNYMMKQGYVSGKLVKYTDKMVEIDGQGTYEVDENLRVYKTYGEIELKTLYDMVVGYDVQKFLIEDGKLCAVLIDRNFVAQNIRVVLKDNGFQDIYHDSILVSSDVAFQFRYGTETKSFLPGEEFTITPDSPYLASGKLVLSTSDSQGKITVKSLERGYGNPQYRGTIEVLKTNEGLVMINELPLEQYLYGVVPSEMPYTYNTEALKAQAVCARSYACRQMTSNTYAWLGAHVDDSTSFQVYNNSAEQTSTNQAVDATYGQVMMNEGEAISAFFYSTSCGSSTDATIWGGDGYDYIKGKMLTGDNVSIDLTDEAQFKMFISTPYNTYDKDYAWYRWNVTVPLAKLTEGVNQMLPSLYASGPEKVLTLEGNEYISKEISTVGNVRSIETGTRGTGGVLEYVIIRGDVATVMIKTESFIRKIFNPSGCDILKNDGSTVNHLTSLPSAFFVTEEVKEGDTLTGYRFIGGGYGHGAGMSQNGANTMGSNGMGYQDILNFFYSNITIQTVY